MTSRLSRAASTNLVPGSRWSFTFFPTIACSSCSTSMRSSRAFIFTLARIGDFCDEDGVQPAEGERCRYRCVTAQLHGLQGQRQVAFRIGTEITQNRWRDLFRQRQDCDDEIHSACRNEHMSIC